MIIFYVDEIILNGLIGLTDSEKNIQDNHKVLGEKYINSITDTIIDYNVASTIGYAGRYLYSTEISLDEKISRMTFVDCQKDEKLMKEMAESFAGISKDFTEKFTAAFYKQLKIYDKICDSVKLTIRKP